jgi:AcrR family transcriptional regulator
MTTATSRPEDADGPLDHRAGALDGRTARRLANRGRILDAALELVAQGVDLDFDEIARSAAVSVRSIYNHFPTARHLVAGMYERGIARMRHYIDDLPTATVPFDQRVKRWVRTWARMQEELAPIRWQALVAEDRHPELQPELADLRKAHLAQIERTFPEITGTQAQAAAAAATDSLTWRVLRRHQGLGFDTACSVVEETLRRLADDRGARSAERAKENR